MVYRKTYCLVRRSFFKRKVLGNRMVMTFASKSNSVAAPSCAVSIRNSKRVLPRKTPLRLVKPQNIIRNHCMTLRFVII